MSGNFQYDGTFSNNILVVGQTGCGKTSFVQSLGKNKIFGDRLKSVDWVSKINLKKSREEKIRECFNYTTIEFHYPDNLPDFYMFLETFLKDAIGDEDKQETTDKDNNNCNYLPVKICLANDFVSEKFFQHFPLFNSVR